ncbi:hypothetical protein J6590_062996 [Homalodisca vitripennis]|nr:hypothetical protein J6590_062996 [Homalodisca vitripennis]
MFRNHIQAHIDSIITTSRNKETKKVRLCFPVPANFSRQFMGAAILEFPPSLVSPSRSVHKSVRTQQITDFDSQITPKHDNFDRIWKILIG